MKGILLLKLTDRANLRKLLGLKMTIIEMLHNKL
jgi:hypothetical protein